MSAGNFEIDKRRVRESFGQAANGYDAVAVLQREVADRMDERLDYVKLQPEVILDAGAGTGYGVRALLKRYRKARVIGLDFSEPMLAQCRRSYPWYRRKPLVCADVEALPLKTASVDLVYSNLTIQWCENLDKVFEEFRRVLKPGGLLMFTTLGPDTLTELRQSWAAVDQDEHVNRFLDMHDVGDALMRSRFADPVMDAERITMTYQRAMDLMRDLKQLGAHNALGGRSHRLTGKQRLRGMLDAYEAFRVGGRLPATWEVVYGHAWSVADKPVEVNVQSMLQGENNEF